jgi:hypothetical protein
VQYGGMKADVSMRLKELETEDAQLKWNVADQTLEVAALKESRRRLYQTAVTVNPPARQHHRMRQRSFLRWRAPHPRMDEVERLSASEEWRSGFRFRCHKPRVGPTEKLIDDHHQPEGAT